MIQVINRAFDILELLSKEPKKVFSLTEIANELELNHATCANIMKTMVHRNYIEQLGHKKGYRIGYMAYQLSGESLYEKELIKAAKDEMYKLTHALNETSLLGVRRKDIRVSLHQEMSDNDLMVKSKIEKHVFSSASGRMLVAALGAAEREDFIKQYGLPTRELWPEASTAAGFGREVKKIIEQGFAKQISEAHIVGYAVPIAKKQLVVASLSVYLPEARVNDKKEKTIVKALKQTATAIDKKLVT
ncbi:helix-turn-helix domain-containing protein [Olivibacter sp. SDN3]|uniref:IclR family transcriptional regulator n=1 Tax=Olivibacter sp. SDN3 TaxID=2764720 RepID=UPI001650F43D|nr:IclR family transcriptional regulator C-terminal domain-containing protein [Olivibacter sp. SDN3]QNL47956.1 helix-turn-helix domain-containing protein [Olivibacter sp. SDN3]